MTDSLNPSQRGVHSAVNSAAQAAAKQAAAQNATADAAQQAAQTAAEHGVSGQGLQTIKDKDLQAVYNQVVSHLGHGGGPKQTRAMRKTLARLTGCVKEFDENPNIPESIKKEAMEKALNAMNDPDVGGGNASIFRMHLKAFFSQNPIGAFIGLWIHFIIEGCKEAGLGHLVAGMEADLKRFTQEIGMTTSQPDQNQGHFSGASTNPSAAAGTPGAPGSGAPEAMLRDPQSQAERAQQEANARTDQHWEAEADRLEGTVSPEDAQKAEDHLAGIILRHTESALSRTNPPQPAPTEAQRKAASQQQQEQRENDPSAPSFG
ncbi:MAG: hypothetical protein EBX40_00835 [Gammaproteobacteria bacterium]|nr:hypothetical protein [Gammaproteobacteria bacterium]